MSFHGSHGFAPFPNFDFERDSDGYPEIDGKSYLPGKINGLYNNDPFWNRDNDNDLYTVPSGQSTLGNIITRPSVRSDKQEIPF